MTATGSPAASRPDSHSQGLLPSKRAPQRGSLTQHRHGCSPAPPLSALAKMSNGAPYSRQSASALASSTSSTSTRTSILTSTLIKLSSLSDSAI